MKSSGAKVKKTANVTLSEDEKKNIEYWANQDPDAKKAKAE